MEIATNLAAANLPLASFSIWPHGVILLLAVLLLFGGRRLPELARGLARGMRIFRDELHGIKTDMTEPTEQKKLDAKPTEPPQENIESKPLEQKQEEKKA
jgi:sec-independent protein translocase protein TatA